MYLSFITEVLDNIRNPKIVGTKDCNGHDHSEFPP